MELSTMTIEEAENILEVVGDALQKERQFLVLPMSLLQGFDLIQLDRALKLRIAGTFLLFSDSEMGDEEFIEQVEKWASLPLHVATSFVPDQEIQEHDIEREHILTELEKLRAERGADSRDYILKELELRALELELRPARSLFDPATGELDAPLGELETATSFAEYCRSLGTENPLYWEMIYSRIGLEYTSSSPRGNRRVYSS